MLRPSRFLHSSPGGAVASPRPLLLRGRRAPAPLRAAQVDNEPQDSAAGDQRSTYAYEVAIVRLQSILADARWGSMRMSSARPRPR
jgi:hypothetical protein